jgi:hypothetical protein
VGDQNPRRWFAAPKGAPKPVADRLNQLLQQEASTAAFK